VAHGHWQVTHNGDGPYLIGSKLDVPVETVIRKIKNNNPGAEVIISS
jgi:hypothetical protein